MILVTGATGNVGRHVVSGLQRAGATVRALSRNANSGDLSRSVKVVHGDLLVPDSLDACLNRVDAVFLIWPFFNADGARAALEVIANHAPRVVFLSALTVRDEPNQPNDPVFHGEIERLIERSGIEWTFLRCSGFATNTLWWAPQIRADGVVRGPYPGAARSLIHEHDIASVAVRSLVDGTHLGKKYVLTGPQALSQTEQVEIIGEVVGRPLRYEEIPRAIARQQMLAWMPASFADAALNYWAGLVSKAELVTRTVEEITGEPARTFRDWATDHISDFS